MYYIVLYIIYRRQDIPPEKCCPRHPVESPPDIYYIFHKREVADAMGKIQHGEVQGGAGAGRGDSGILASQTRRRRDAHAMRW